MSLSGNLKTLPFADLLQVIALNRKAGTLQIWKEQVVKMIFFQEGKIISSSSSDPREYLGHFLISRGLITEEELRFAMEIQKSSRMLLGKILVMGNKVSEEQMTRLLITKAEESIYSIFLWDEADFLFHDDQIREQIFIRLNIDPQSLTLEGLYRKDEWARIRMVFPHSQVVLEKSTRTPAEAMSPFAKRTWALLDGKRSIDDMVLALHSVEYTVSHALLDFYNKGWIQVRESSVHPDAKAGQGGDHSPEHLLKLARQNFGRQRLEEALDLLRAIDPSAADYQKEVGPFLRVVETQTVLQITRETLPLTTVLKLAISLEKAAGTGLSPEEGFLLSRIDGTWDVQSILSVTPMKEVDVLRSLKRLLKRRIISIG